MMRKGFPLLLLLMTACTAVPSQSTLDSVDPFIGTGGDGHTYPGATAPFGMVQLSPDTHNSGWEAASGYRDKDTTLIGFSPSPSSTKSEAL